MKHLTYYLLLLVNIAFAQSNKKFPAGFLPDDELKTENVLVNYNQFDFSGIWTQTENHFIFGIIGTEHQRIKIKLLSVSKNSTNQNEYLVSGKSNVHETICDFSGTIKLTEIKETKKLHFGVDDEYRDKGIKSQGIAIAEYEFSENRNQNHSGVFKGKLYSKWYLTTDNQLKYDDIGSMADGYMNNAFVGTWNIYSPGKQKICNWADFRVPNANNDFDIGAGEFSPYKKYSGKGWDNYQKAWLDGDEKAKKEELKEWWK
jgi:hypothetical protein